MKLAITIVIMVAFLAMAVVLGLEGAPRGLVLGCVLLAAANGALFSS